MSKFMNVPSKEGLRPLFPYKRYASIQCAALCLALTALVSCSSEKKPGGETASENPAKPTAKVAQYDTGRIAFQRMFLSARGWAGDAKPFRLQSQYTLDAPTSEGKAGLWRASFASPSRRMMKLFVWSGLVGPDAPEQGISFSAEDSWSPSNTSTQPFDIAFLKTDSDKAYEVAQKNGGEKRTSKNPKEPVTFALAWDSANNQLVWHVLYGDNPSQATLRIAVDATTGAFLRVEK
jgi:hypothetical protein